MFVEVNRVEVSFHHLTQLMSGGVVEPQMKCHQQSLDQVFGNYDTFTVKLQR